MSTGAAPPRIDGLEARTDAAFAAELDARDPLADYRGRFEIPMRDNGSPVHYFCGNSLGLQPKRARTLVEAELDKWSRLAVDAHFADDAPWYSYHELFRETGARLVGARPGEVVMMNSLTVNLHLMMVSFYRPTAERYRILMEAPAFPSDTYALKTHIATHGLDPSEALGIVEPREGESTIHDEDWTAAIEREGDRLALVMLGGVNFFTGQRFDLARVTEAAHANGAIAGFDLAHAVGNVPLSLHDWDVDFAAWCSYKYLNSSPGAIAGCFVHERHGKNPDLVRYAGWWGNDPSTRFRMHLEPDFIPREGADGWQLSNPPILAMAPLRASLEIFDEVGMDRLRAKSERLTGYLEWLIDSSDAEGIEIITPRDPERRGCQLSLLIHENAKAVVAELERAGCVVDFREPDVIRVAPVPLYNTFQDVHALAGALTLRR